VTPPLLETALKYAERDFRVFPLRDSGDDGNRRLPQHKDWPSVATCDAKTIRRWWMLTPGAGIGIATGAGLLVLDVDRKNGKDGDASLAALIAEHGEFPATLSATTPNGGTHYYLRGSAELRNSACKVGDGLDIRAHHGYVVAPSPARCGSGYAWRNDEEIADAPPWLVHAAMAHEKREPVETAPAIKVDAKLAAEIRSAANALNPDDYDTWIFVGHALFSLGAFGREVWLTWSQQSAKWQPSDARRWETFAASQIEYQALFARAQREHWCNPMAGSSPAPGATSAAVAPPKWELRGIPAMRAARTPSRQLIRGRLPAGILSCLYGASGSAKTFVATDRMFCIAAGVRYHGCDVEQGPGVMLVGEGHGGVLKRVDALGQKHGINPDDLPIFISSAAIDLSATYESVVDAIRAACGDVRPVYVVVDTLHRHLRVGAKENTGEDIAPLIAAADSIKDEFGCTVTLVHHTGHQADDRERGWSGMRASWDWSESVQRNDKDVVVTCRKAKDWDEPAPMTFALESVELPYEDAYGVRETSAVLRIKESAGDALVRGTNQRRALDAIKALTYARRRDDEPVRLAEWREASKVPAKRWGEVCDALVDRSLVRIAGDYVELVKEVGS
jgi:hypothetical protein